MARVTRRALDLALVSLKIVRPAVSKVWTSTKGGISETRIKPLVANPVVSNVEKFVDKLTVSLTNMITRLRNKVLPAEKIYLEKELEKIKIRIQKSEEEEVGRSSTCKSMRPALGTAWQYAKIEVAPPMTTKFFRGPGGKKLEDSVAKLADGFMASIQSRIKEIEAEESRKIKEKEAEILAAQQKVKDAARKREEERKKAAEAQKASETKKAQAKKTEEKPKEEKKAVPPKAAKKPEPKKGDKKK